MSKTLMCSPELLRLDLSGKTFVVTGANSGLGFEASQQLAIQGAHVVLACRNAVDGEGAAHRIRTKAPEASLEVQPLDLSQLASVRQFARKFVENHSSLHGLLNNAGVMNTPKGKTADGFETQFGVNHLGHFLLTELLLETLKKSSPARIVNLSSCFHDKAMGRVGDIHFDDIHFDNRKYDGWEAYAQSKLANLLHARELSKRLEGTGVVSASVHPGWVRTRLMKHSVPLWAQDYVLRPVLRLAGMIEPWEGVQSSLHALLAPEVEKDTGAFFSQKGIYRDKTLNRGGWPLHSSNPNAHDDAVASRLWTLSESLVAER